MPAVPLLNPGRARYADDQPVHFEHCGVAKTVDVPRFDLQHRLGANSADSFLVRR